MASLHPYVVAKLRRGRGISKFLRARLASGKRKEWRNYHWKRQNGRCFYCSTPIERDAATADHKQPISRGGADHCENVVAACAPCNHEKDNMTTEEYQVFRALSRPKDSP